MSSLTEPKRKATRIYFVRHGAVENPHAIRYGRLPGYHLSDEGRRQIELTARRFSKLPISAIYTSPLERTQQTATIIGRQLPEAKIVLDQRLIELKLPPTIEGKHRDCPNMFENAAELGGETPQDISRRMASFIEEKIVEHNGESILAITHGDPISIIRNHFVYANFSPEYHYYPAYGSVAEFVYTGLTLNEIWYWRTTSAGARRT